ncbi:uncharacterized protein LOC121189298 [Toxotes jaculatrix]|uniref:uncharacterized protein LOC121189298 n=1 Tax=Toxotes jaculatrix TaxID=941984 RepID=UPI001B3A86BA|nr:uncharacterized protein LOC121189298 [Toxotes jaculatrix]
MENLDYSFHVEGYVAGRGTGRRHHVQKWPVSSLTGRQHKLVIPDESPDKQFVLLVGDSHLRAIADGFVEMPGTRHCFGVMSTPGATAADLRIEVMNAVLVRSPDAVCLLAPSNNLTARTTVDESSADFARLLYTVCSRWEKVCVIDFPPRLNVPMDLQELLRKEYHRVAVSMGISAANLPKKLPVLLGGDRLLEAASTSSLESVDKVVPSDIDTEESWAFVPKKCQVEPKRKTSSIKKGRAVGKQKTWRSHQIQF